MTTPEPTAAEPAELSDLPEIPPEAPPAPSIADGTLRSLDPRSVTLGRISSWIFAGVVALAVLGVSAILWGAPAPPWVATLITLLGSALVLALGVLAHRWPKVAHRHTSYKVDDDGIEIRRGVFWRTVINVPRSRVQHTDVAQGPLERSFGLGTLVIYTAGTDHAKVDLAGLDHATAFAIRDHLLPREGGDAV